MQIIPLYTIFAGFTIDRIVQLLQAGVQLQPVSGSCFLCEPFGNPPNFHIR
jgi:hypothetical protein